MRMQIKMQKWDVGNPFLNLLKERLQVQLHVIKTGDGFFGTQIGLKS